MKKTKFLCVIILLVAVLITYLIIDYYGNNCNYDNPYKTYISKSLDECVTIDYDCVVGELFQDKCGCGCEVVEYNNLQIRTNKINYDLGEDIELLIKNNLGYDIWLPTNCGEPFWLTRWDGAKWIAFERYGFRDCVFEITRLNSSKELKFTLETKNNLVMGEGFYQTQVNYDNREFKVGENRIYQTAYSNMFRIGELKKQDIEVVGMMLCSKGCFFNFNNTSFSLADERGDPEKDFIDRLGNYPFDYVKSSIIVKVKGKFWEEIVECPSMVSAPSPEDMCQQVSGIYKYIDMTSIEELPRAELGEECSYEIQCRNIDCSSYDDQVVEGHEPFCVDNECKCMCYGCL